MNTRLSPSSTTQPQIESIPVVESMVKKQKDKQYQSSREHRANQQERSGNAGVGSTGTVQRLLPFSHCALTLVPFETPVCNKGGILFENTAVVAFILRHKIDPVTGDVADTASLVRLHIDKNDEGRWQCPILTKPFTDHSKVVAVLQPGGKEANVYSFESFQELNIKAKNYTDLLSGEKFDKTKDVLVLFDPNDVALNLSRDINSFYHVKHVRDLEKTKEPESRVRHNVATSRIMDKIKKDEAVKLDLRKAEMLAQQKKRKADESLQSANTNTNYTSVTAYLKNGKRLKVLAEDVTGVKYTELVGAASSLTSTAIQVADHNRGREANGEEILQAQCNVMRNKLKKKGYVKIRTNHGTMTLELHCDIVPRTCMNFLELCQTKKYDNSVFHRLIPNFMIQGGKPATNDEADECIWGGSFVDEFDDRLKHSSEGVVSMANAGSNTNKRQFFLTFQACPHLDRKHSVFGNVVEGKELLAKFEQFGADKKERPLEEIKILDCEILMDPAREAHALEQARLEQLLSARQKVHKPAISVAVASESDEVGRYLKIQPEASQAGTNTSKQHSKRKEEAPTSKILPLPSSNKPYGDFSGW